MNIIQFAGFTQAEVDAMMPRVVEILGLGHDTYSARATNPVVLYDRQGKRQGTGKMIIVPGFDAIRADLNLLNDLSSEFGVPATSSLAPVKLALGDKLY